MAMISRVILFMLLKRERGDRMKISEYPKTENLDPTDSFIIETDAGTKSVQVEDMVFPKSLSNDNAIVHKTNIRGKNLGDTYTPEQKEAINSGTFNDLYIGDYWEKDDVKWQIVDINYFLNTSNHLAIMPTKSIAQSVLDERTTANIINSVGYNNCHQRIQNSNPSANLYTDTSILLDHIYPLFGQSNVMPVSLYFSTGVTNNDIVYGLSTSTLLSLPTCSQIMGFPGECLLSKSNTQNMPQLAYFKLIRDNDPEEYWTRDINSSAYMNYIQYGNSIAQAAMNKIKGIRSLFYVY